jgi:hypothetical protein
MTTSLQEQLRPIRGLREANPTRIYKPMEFIWNGFVLPENEYLREDRHSKTSSGTLSGV